MIKIDATNLLTEIARESATWLTRAQETVRVNRGEGRYKQKTPNWSDIKEAYVRVQHSKCAYCEKELSEEDLGAIDMEHYRPKSSVRAWPTQAIKEEREIDYDLPNRSSEDEGYYLLTHNVWNYVASCKTCNSLKSDFFPVKGNLNIKLEDPAESQDQPYILYPLGDLDEDPEDFFKFTGISPVIVATSEEKKKRAQVTIDFFDLARRPVLEMARAKVIQDLGLFQSLLNGDNSEEVKQMAEQTIERYTSASAPHSSCAKSFRALQKSDPQAADEIFRLAHEMYTEDQGNS